MQNSIPSECTATVRDYERCLTDILGLLDEAGRAQCRREVDSAELDALMDFESNTPESCQVFSEAECGGAVF